MRVLVGDGRDSCERAAGTPAISPSGGNELLTDFPLPPILGSAESSDAPQHVRMNHGLGFLRVSSNECRVSGVSLA